MDTCEVSGRRQEVDISTREKQRHFNINTFNELPTGKQRDDILFHQFEAESSQRAETPTNALSIQSHESWSAARDQDPRISRLCKTMCIP
jgi:hypothetical protein